MDKKLAAFIAFVKSLPAMEREQMLFAGRWGEIRRLLQEHVAVQKRHLRYERRRAQYPCFVTHTLHRSPNVINQLITQGGYAKIELETEDGQYTEEVTSSIIAQRFPVTETGKAKVRFGLLARDNITHLPNADLREIRLDEVQATFDKRNMRFPDLAEALLLPAKDRQLGRQYHSIYVAHIRDTNKMVVVDGFSYENSHSRYLKILKRKRTFWDDANDSVVVFVGVCEE